MTANFLLLFCTIWAITLGSIVVGKRRLLWSTWREPYCNGNVIAVESDDWGPGPAWHSERIDAISATLSGLRDTRRRRAIMTANLILATPDVEAMRTNVETGYRRLGIDESSPEVVAALKEAVRAGTFAVQLHGLEHCYGPGYAKCLANKDARLSHSRNNADCFEWESLDSALQAHFVDASELPSIAVEEHEQREQVAIAVEMLERIFGVKSRSAVAPCYLWNDFTEQVWKESGVEYIQTAGYRCSGRGDDGAYIQDISLIAPGATNRRGQTYLVRTLMYEPKDGRGVETCLREARWARLQRLPLVISTHRYNYTDTSDNARESLAGLNRVLQTILDWSPLNYFVSSEELGDWICTTRQPPSRTRGQEPEPLMGFSKVHAYLARLWFRHAKLRLISLASLLVVPGFLVYVVSRGSHIETDPQRNAPVTS